MALESLLSLDAPPAALFPCTFEFSDSAPASGEFPCIAKSQGTEEDSLLEFVGRDDLPPASVRGATTLALSLLDDAGLVEAARAGERRAATAIWNRYSRLVRGMLRRSVGRDDVDDGVQEVFIRLFAGLGQLRQASSLRSFLIGITLRVAGTDLRRKRSRSWLQLTPTGDVGEFSSGATSDDTNAPEALARLHAILDRQSPGARLVFVLRYVEGMDLTEVAAALDISLATAKRHLARASARVFAMVERDPALVDYLSQRSGSGSEDQPRAARSHSPRLGEAVA